MNKVGNLRAMFEQKGETSPPDRGRSPGLPPTIPSAESPRPLSKVRTNFIAIEKDGRIGLQRDPSTESSPSVSRGSLNNDTKPATPPAQQEKTSILGDRSDRGGKPGNAMETVTPSPAQQTRGQPSAPKADVATTPQNKDKVGHSKHKEPAATAHGGSSSSKGKDSQVPHVAEGGKTAESKTAGAGGGPASNRAAAGGGRVEPVRNGTVGHQETSAKVASKEAPKATVTRAPPKPISTTAKTTTFSTKSPTVLKTPTSPVKPQIPKLSSKSSEKKALRPEKTDKTSTPKATPSATKATASSSSKNLPSIDVSPLSRGIGFVKPKPKSPTRPVTLPSGLTTHTAASATKFNVPRQSLSRQSGNYQLAHRAPSRASVSTVATTGTTGTKNLRRQSSTVNRQRPSFGPPPKPRARDHPVTQNEKPVDEDFLARMMRHTQSSSSKTRDPTVSPPREQPTALGRRPATRQGQSAKMATESKNSTPVKKIVPRPAAPTATQGEESSPAKTIASAVEKQASAEEAIAIAKKAEGTVSLPTKTTVTPETTPQKSTQKSTPQTSPESEKPQQSPEATPAKKPEQIPEPEAEPEQSTEPEIPTMNGKHPIPSTEHLELSSEDTEKTEHKVNGVAAKGSNNKEEVATKAEDDTAAD